jgi:DNA-binding response OmpR family regulator
MSHVLLIEPDRVTGRVYQRALEHAGWRTVLAHSGQDAILAADAATPDVVVMEADLAGHSAAAFLYEFRSYADWRDVPVILHTGITPARLEPFAGALKQLGVREILYKPQQRLQMLINRVSEYVK